MEPQDPGRERMPISYRQKMLIDFSARSEAPDMALAYALCIGLGVFGAHRFYLGERRTGIAMLVLGLTVAGLAVTLPWAVIDLVLIPGMIGRRVEEARGRLTAELRARVEAGEEV